MNSNKRYDDYLAKKYAQEDEQKQLWDSRAKLESEKSLGAVEDLAPTGEGVAQTNWLGQSNLTQNDALEDQKSPESSGGSAGSGAMAAGETLAQGGGAEDAVAKGLMMSGDPFAMGAGLALQTASSIKKGQNQREQQKYLAEVDRVTARQNAINKMAQIGQGLKA
jgi:hypothetical protein